MPWPQRQVAVTLSKRWPGVEASMIVPKQAPVRPRVILPDGEGETLLEDLVRAWLDAG